MMSRVRLSISSKGRTQTVISIVCARQGRHSLLGDDVPILHYTLHASELSIGTPAQRLFI